MKINLISSLEEGWTLDRIISPNQVYAWFLHEAFVGVGVDARFVKCSKLKQEHPPKADYTIVISAAAYTYMTTMEGYAERLRESTAEKLVCYMNTDELRYGDHYFDHCFTQIEPRGGRPEKYVCVGWGVDPTYSYPEQDEKAAFLDSKVLHKLSMKSVTKVYQAYDNVLPKLDMKIYAPVPVYNKDPRLPYPDYQSILRKCHYFLCTQFGEGGITRLEAAACGALLVVPAKFRPRKTMKLFNHRLWYTEEDLIEALDEPVDIEANRRRALEHRWEDVTKRMLELLEK